MGWASGSDIAYRLIKTIQENVLDDHARQAIYEDLIDAFEDADCDTLYECIGVDPVFDCFFDGYDLDEISHREKTSSENRKEG